jgi:trans-AT polyketide synthase, acyltransferase and oxidoreductase domains
MVTALEALSAVERPCWAVAGEHGPELTTTGPAPGQRVLAAVGPLREDSLGASSFTRHHGVRRAVMSGAMAGGIASAELVTAMARAGYLGSFGAAGLTVARIEDALTALDRVDAPYAVNLIHSPHEPALERTIVEACLRHGVRTVEASAFLDLTEEVVRYRASGLRRGPDGTVATDHRVIAKVSRAEVAEVFLRPAPEPLLRRLAERGAISAEQAELARTVPMADDLTAEADSGGHTDRRPLPVLLPAMLALAEQVARETGTTTARVGAAGGIGTPAAMAAAFAAGAAYVVTGSVNQSCVEADQCAATKELLAGAGVADTVMAPSADMFELGVDVQVLGRGTMFPARARRLFELYRSHDALEDLTAAERAELEERILRRSVAEVWDDTRRFFAERDPAQVTRAEADPKRRMALVFRWYLGLSSTWSSRGEPDRVLDYQIWCGPAMGAFNTWVAGTHLAAPGNRRVAEVTDALLRGAAVEARATALRLAGLRLPPSASTYRPQPAADVHPAEPGPVAARPTARATAPGENR